MQTPKLDIYYIQIEETTDKGSDTPKKKSGVGKLLTGAAAVFFPPAALAVGANKALSATTGTDIIASLGDSAKDIKRILDENRFHIIRTEEELSQYENANGSAWKRNEKSLRSKQYYIRHPKSEKQNLLIEAQNFYNYIDEEQKEELVQFIVSHCPVKRIAIDREEIQDAVAGGNGQIKSSDISGEFDYAQHKGKYFDVTFPNGVKGEEPRQKYHWIDASLLTSVKYMSEGSVLTQRYENDFRFGLAVSEATTLGLNLSCHKNYVYTVHVEC